MAESARQPNPQLWLRPLAALGLLCRSGLACGLNDGIDFLAVTCNYGVQLLLDLAQKPRGIDPGEVPVNVLVNNFDEREQLGQ